MIAFLASDLLWSSRIRATAEALGLPSRRIDAPEDLAPLLAAGPVRLVLIDLEARDAWTLISTLRGPDASERARQTPTLAWAPHVCVEDLEQARSAGVERVLTRGAFAASLETIVAQIPRAS